MTEALTAYFSIFLGVYLLCGAVFFITFLKTNGKEFKSFLGLSVSISLYLLGSLLFCHSQDPHFNANLILPLQSGFGAASFYFYVCSVEQRVYIKNKFTAFLKGSMIFFIFLLTGYILLFVTDTFYLSELSEEKIGNGFLAAYSGNYAPKMSTKAVFSLFPLIVALGNIYLFRRFIQAKLSGPQKLMTIGSVFSLLSNLNDNLMGIGILTWAVPSIQIGYLVETYYFLAFSLRSGAYQNELNKPIPNFLSDRPNSTDQRSFSDVFAYAASISLKNHPHLDVSIETSVGEEKIYANKVEGLLVVFYHLISEILQSIDKSPLRRGKIELTRGDVEGSIVIIEDSPTNYVAGEAPSEQPPYRAMKVSEVFGLELRVIAEAGVNKYEVRL